MPQKNDAHRDEFIEWIKTKHGNNVLQKFIKIALAIKEMGHKHYSGQAIVYYLRVDTDIEHGPDEFKINNNYGSYLARYAMGVEPGLADFFRIREAGDD